MSIQCVNSLKNISFSIDDLIVPMNFEYFHSFVEIMKDFHYFVLMMRNYHYDLNERMIDFDYEMNTDHFHYYVDNHRYKNFED